MKFINYNHNVFTKYKDVNLTVDLSIVAPPGAGINFISSLFHPEVEKKTLNEYTNNNIAVFNYIDCIVQRATHPTVDIDTFAISYEDLETLVKQYLHEIHVSNNYIKSMVSHQPPNLLHKIFNLNLKEQLYINTTNESHWFIEMLATIKKYTRVEYADKQNIHEVLSEHITACQYAIDNNIDLNSLRPTYEHTVLARSILQNTGVQYGSVLWWKYFFNCILFNCGITTHTYKDYNSLQLDRDLEFNSTTNKKYNDYVDSCASISPIFNKINYEDFFFKLQVPNTKNFKKINKKHIYDYSIKNINVVSKFATTNLLDYANDIVQEKCNCYRNMLNTAIDKTNNI